MTITSSARGLISLLRNLPFPPGQTVGIIAVLVLERLRPASLPGRRAAQRAAGAVALTAGAALTVWALAERRRHTNGGFELERPQSLVTTGPHAFSRHPMYVGWWLIHLGAGLLRASAWVTATLPAAVLAEHGGVLAEERALEREFGDEYARYRERVPRYIGRVSGGGD
ncbi:methyltransferase family protein [Agromyces laixinhei]|uniref:methyltransferase family protein n=1 Tax=Agromyces laixinhei TaxID=2585717 RepID=UPI0012ED16BD|nr:isoprenylcysteine carboxylmethyltransferase family protein [Agromyces laixinhei]